VCLHPNTMTEAALDRLDRALGGEFRGRVATLGQIKLRNRSKTIVDRLYHLYFWRHPDA
jgi:hypothetical protein